MILLDTNVLSALMQRRTDPAVVAWLDAQPPESIWTTAVTVFEVWFGLAILRDGRRRRRLQAAFAQTLQEDFDGRVLPFDAAARKATLATRNTRYFEGLGIPIVNPRETKR